MLSAPCSNSNHAPPDDGRSRSRHTDDGYKIVVNVFGDNSDKVIHRLGSAKQDSMMSKQLPMLAPVVMAYLA